MKNNKRFVNTHVGNSDFGMQCVLICQSCWRIAFHAVQRSGTSLFVQMLIQAGLWLSQPENERLPGILVGEIVHLDQCRTLTWILNWLNHFTGADVQMLLQGLHTHVCTQTHREKNKVRKSYCSKLLLYLWWSELVQRESTSSCMRF